MVRRILVSAMILVISATAGCIRGSGGGTPGPPAGSTRSASAPGPKPPAWRVADSVPLKSVSGLHSVVAVDDTHAWAVGGEGYNPARRDSQSAPVIERWDGRAWSRVTLPNRRLKGSGLLAAADSPTNVWVVGGYGESQGDNMYWILRFDGTAWREEKFPLRPSNSLTSINGLAVAGGRAWLVGTQGSKVVLLEWAGGTWRAHRAPAECERGGASFDGMPNFCVVSSVVAFAPDDVWAGGNGAWSGFLGPVLFHWNGSAWRAVTVGANRKQYTLSAIGGRSSAELWAVGNLFNSGTPFVVRRDGDTWRMTFGGLPEGRLPAVAIGADGRPWVISNSIAPDAMLMRYTDADTWSGELAPRPVNAYGVTLNDITGVPASSRMFAVGQVNGSTPGEGLEAVILEYAPVDGVLS